MPTAARLVSAILLAALAYLVTTMYMNALLAEDPDENFGRLMEVNVVISALVGWVLLGGRVGNQYSVAIGLGLTSVAAALFWCLFAHSIWEMLDMSLDRRFDGPMEALIGAIELGIEFAAELARPNIIVTLVVGGIVLGPAAEFASRRWR